MMQCSKIKRVALLSSVLAAPAEVLAAHFAVLLVGAVAVGISGVLIVQAFIGILLVLRKRYTSRDPSHFIAIAVVFLLIGTISVLSEVARLSLGDLAAFLALMYVPGAIAIFPPLMQRLRQHR